jgi:hypothetical protein
MLASFFSDATAPFAVALCLMALIALLEVVGALMGLAPSDMVDSMLPDIDVDADMDMDVDLDLDLEGGLEGVGSPLDTDAVSAPDAPGAGPLSSILGWLCVGRVPVLVLLMVFLTAFGLSGFLVQGAAQSLLPVALPALLASVPAVVVGVFATRWAGLGLAKIMPKEQTEAVSQKRFIGRIATVVRGEARADLPAEAKLTDRHGQTHYLMVEPDDAEAVFPAGEAVLIVKQVGGRYRVIANPNPHLTDA